ncbi:MAG: hypothetical protein KAQ83_00705 [Nanoarchaeota archaeon]|nr:hypothetical protein [Nanoarchaeota archaeon]
MDNNQLKIISLTLLILVIVFSAGTTWKIMGENAVSKENMLDSSNTVTTGRVSIDIQKLRSPQKGEVNIKIIPQGDTI